MYGRPETVGKGKPASEKENLEEEREFLAGLDLPDCYFWALHPLDSVKLDGILREEKQQMLDALTSSIENVNESAINRTSVEKPKMLRYAGHFGMSKF